jgi:hypothetical protein
MIYIEPKEIRNMILNASGYGFGRRGLLEHYVPTFALKSLHLF